MKEAHNLTMQSGVPMMPIQVGTSIEEQNNWFVACDNSTLSKYMNPKVFNEKHEGIISDYGFGKINNTGWVDTKLLLEDYKNYLTKKMFHIKNVYFVTAY